jgi:hypothetical protein
MGGILNDIDKAIVTFQRAEKLMTNGHPHRRAILFNMGDTLPTRFSRTGIRQDISDAIEAQRGAMDLTAKGHADLPALCLTMGHSLHALWRSTGNLEDLEASIGLFKSAATYTFGSPTHRLDAARHWGKALRAHHPRSSEVVLAFNTAIGTLALMAGFEQTVDLRYQNLRHVSDVSLEAAVAAFELGRPDKAVEWLEQGRCLVWNQLNNLRSSMEDLQVHDHQLVQDLRVVATQLESTAVTRKSSHLGMSISEKITVEDEARVHLTLATRRDELLQTARSIPGFEDFLLPPSSSSILQHLPESGAVVVINVHPERCDAIALLASLGEPLHIPLPKFTLERANEYYSAIGKQLAAEHVRVRGWEEEGDDDDEDEDGRALGRYRRVGGERTIGLREVLKSLWDDVVKPILNTLGYSVNILLASLSFYSDIFRML